MPLSLLYRRFFRYPLWRLRNPTTPYEQFYAHVVNQRLTRKQDHPAIGETARPVRSSTELLDVMLQHGLESEHRAIDYGCGSLRLGRALIEYLEPRKFMGMDIAREFLDLGREFVGSNLMQEKQPGLVLITEHGMEEGRAFRPDYIGSWHVCSKVPPQHMRRYLENVIGLMSSQTQAFIQFPQTDRPTRLNHLNWTMSKDSFSSIVRAISGNVRVDFVEFVPRNHAGVTETYAHLHREQTWSSTYS